MKLIQDKPNRARASSALVHQPQDHHVQPHADERTELLPGFGNAGHKDPALPVTATIRPTVQHFFTDRTLTGDGSNLQTVGDHAEGAEHAAALRPGVS